MIGPKDHLALLSFKIKVAGLRGFKTPFLGNRYILLWSYAFSSFGPR
jgi:hypothetical protein